VSRFFLLISMVSMGLAGCATRPTTSTPTIPGFSSATISDGDFDWSIVKDGAPNPNPNTVCLGASATHKGVPVSVFRGEECGRFGFRVSYPHPQILAETYTDDDYYSVLMFIPLNLSVKVDGMSVKKNGYFAVLSGPISGRPIEILFKHGRCTIVPPIKVGPCEAQRRS
jgi:hypothetical protein